MRVSRLIDHGGLEVCVSEHALLLAIALVTVRLIHTLLNRLTTDAAWTWSTQIWAASWIIYDLRRALM